jgi:hypothetical protein
MASLSDFKNAFAAYRVRSLALSASIFATMIVGGLATLSRAGELRPFLYSRYGDDWGGAMLGAIPFSPALVVCFGGIWWLERWVRSDKRLLCPGCAKSLAHVSGTVIASRNCPLCGERVLTEE